MTRKYKEGDRVEVLRGNRWMPGTVSGEKFNNGNGGYFPVNLDNGDYVVMDAARIRRLA